MYIFAGTLFGKRDNNIVNIKVRMTHIVTISHWNAYEMAVSNNELQCNLKINFNFYS